ncbi:NADH-quinone oxidoreductase subunit 5 family protein [Xylanibacter oryzae]|uniref:NADH-quinone oxidoreductase subunit 5 family protein n=1 Tax=Xylanibacter oryzae TaxID=185293 RepID=UPI0005634C88|nr:NADH-quinone oxidoreductase subunit L [Xylanibacter oryzae]
MDYSYVFLILLLPALSFVLLGLAGMKMSHKVAGIIGTVVLGTIFCLSYYTAFEYFLGQGRGADGLFPTITPFNFTWLKFNELLTFNIGFRLTPISVMMLVVITTVSFMVHIYSFGYMHGEKGFQRYYAFLSLFTMSMLGLVVATNIFQMYLFWELVGVSSYLLIGFYYPKHTAVAASKKAFIVTRFADLFFLIGILIYSYYVGTFNFDLNAMPELAGKVAGAAQLMPLALFFMFIGGAGKSAMFPLHIWLPDAMEGPTPVSALIHAATMVVAGVYLVASMFPLFVQYAPAQLHWIAYIAAFTAFYAAAVACCQSDIKRVLAFSTISQIGFMLVALGVSMPDAATGAVAHTAEYADSYGLGYMAGMFHLFTHAMFKGCLFLCAGCIIEAVGSNEKNFMGNLRKYMPITHIAFLICCLAISGIWPLSGFFSKDEILVACYNFNPVMGMIMSGIACMTAFYMFRLYYVIFWGQGYYEKHINEGAKKPHEAPACMTFPLIFLSLITVLCGWIPFGHFVSANGLSFDTHVNWTVAITSTVLALSAIALATFMYSGKTTPVADYLAKKFPRLHEAAYHRFYIDEVWMFVTHKVIFRCISKPIAWFDRHVVDGAMNFMAWGTNAAGDSIRGWQSGDVRQYAVWFLTGTIALTLFLLCICL